MAITGPKRKAKQVEVPAIEDDPAERKRVLNILAQRRYRRRKQEHLQKLEEAAGSKASDSTSEEQSSETSAFRTPQQKEPLLDNDFNQPHHVDPAVNSGYFALQPFVPQIIEPNSQQQPFDTTDCLDPKTLEAFDAQFGSYSFHLPSLPASPSLHSSDTSTDTFSHATTSENTSFSFPDEIHFPMLELNLLRGAMAIARRLNVDQTIWSLESDSPFHNSHAMLYTHLPANLQPTPIQLRKPHHPVLDVLPWPSVRNRLILVFNQPLDVRPPTARSPTALLDLVYDLEDPAEGVRIWGDDPCEDKNWEIGEKFFVNWWWCLNSQVLNRSNEIRRERGAKVLGVDTTREFEEVR